MRHSILLLEHVLLLTNLTEPGVFERLRGRDTVVGVVDEELLDEIDDLRAGLWDELRNALALDAPHAELGEVHMARMPLELV